MTIVQTIRLPTVQKIRWREDGVSYSPYLQLIDSHPTIWGKALEHGHQELETARPVADQEHHADKVEYAHEHARHVQELKKRKTVKNCWKTDLELVEDDPAIFGEALEHWDKKLQAARPMAHQ